MKWIIPVAIAVMYSLAAMIWNLMRGRWKRVDWEELLLGFLIMTGLLYLVFFGYAGLLYLNLPVPPLAVVGIVGASIFLFFITRVRHSLGRKGHRP